MDHTGITRYPMPTRDQVPRCSSFHNLYSNMNIINVFLLQQKKVILELLLYLK